MKSSGDRSATQTLPAHIPTVTESDLLEFHTRNFPGVARPSSFFPHATAPATAEVDPLGYYDDGSKRTLTDQQIAMFRHSEIQDLLRSRRRHVEATTGPSNSPSAVGADSADRHEPDNPLAERFAAELYEPVDMPFKAKGKRKPRKRKWQDVDAPKKGFENEEGVTYRRVARELDEKVEDRVELDY